MTENKGIFSNESQKKLFALINENITKNFIVGYFDDTDIYGVDITIDEIRNILLLNINDLEKKYNEEMNEEVKKNNDLKEYMEKNNKLNEEYDKKREELEWERDKKQDELNKKYDM